MFSLSKLSATSITIVFSILFFVVTQLFPGHGYTDFLFMFATSAAVIYAIFIIFSIDRSHERFGKVNELLKTEDANVRIIYNLSHVFGATIQDKVRDLLDSYLIDQVDYRLEDFYYSSGSFNKLYEYVLALEPKGKKQESVYDELINVLTLSSINRVQIEAYTKQKISRVEWMSVWALTFLVISHTYEMTRGDIFSSILLTIMASAVLLMTLMLRDLNSLKWQKDEWTWQPLHRTFVHLNLLPYYPGPIIDSGEARPDKGQEILV